MFAVSTSKCKKPGLVFLAGLLLSGCAQQPIELNSAARDISGYSQIENLPFFPQTGDQCGPSSLATVLAASGIETTPAYLKPSVYLPERRGSLALELVAAARQFGRLVYTLHPKPASLLLELSAGNPVLVLQNLRFPWWPQWHFAVVTGYDLNRSEFILRSGLEQEYRIDMDLFDLTWRRANRWAIVVTKPGELPASATPVRLLDAGVDMEELGMLSEAEMVYRAALRRWPQHPTALMALANLAFLRQRFGEADDLYRKVIASTDSKRALQADAWNNLGYTLMKLDCPETALQAARCALYLQPGKADYLDSIRELKHMDPGRDRPPGIQSCQPAQCHKLP